MSGDGRSSAVRTAQAYPSNPHAGVYPMTRMVDRTISAISRRAEVVISPAPTARPVVVAWMVLPSASTSEQPDGAPMRSPKAWCRSTRLGDS